ncbi:MAG: biopolymer transporter ExbD [Herminiimonas sp.]|jgi:biopolymer transport protein ExbD|nr:biopolymer transporter ExbD [Herminiimonas sp.]
MAFGGFNDNSRQTPMSDINVTPMVDVMLVLLVIFIITAPMFTHAIKLDLPAAQAAPAPEKPETVSISIDGAGRIFWNDSPVEQKDLGIRLTAAAQKKPQPELQLRADKSTRYEVIAQVMATAQGSGMTKLGFVTDPKDAARTNTAPGK